jgi:four helix bundle protein
MTVQSYRDLEVYQTSFEGAVKIHEMTLRLPKYELYEVGSQIRRSAKSIPANIAEGFGRRRYKNEYIHFLTIALASCDETQVHLDMLHATGNLDAGERQSFSAAYDTLGKKPKPLPATGDRSTRRALSRSCRQPTARRRPDLRSRSRVASSF